MLGRFKSFNDARGFGFIIGEDGQSYFAHASEVKSVELPYRNAPAEFTPSQNTKGLIATEIHIQATKPDQPEFIQIFAFRIKLSNIKNYQLAILSNYAYKTPIGLTYYTNRSLFGTREGTFKCLLIEQYSGGTICITDQDTDILKAAEELDRVFGIQRLDT